MTRAGRSRPAPLLCAAVLLAAPPAHATPPPPARAPVATDRARLEVLATMRVYFQHASVGGQACGVYDPGGFRAPWGLERILAENPGAGASLARNATTAAAIPLGTIGEWSHGAHNGQPLEKLAAFERALRGGLGGAVDYALFKIGYADFDQAGNLTGKGGAPAATWFATRYRPAMEALQAAYPATRIIHVTVPVQKARAHYGNAGIQRFNELLRSAYPGRVFDLARWQGVGPAGGAPQIGPDGAPCMNDAWANPPDNHVNQAGADWLAARLLEFLAGRP